MWTPQSLGQAVWQVDGSHWSIDARGGSVGIQFTDKTVSISGVDDAVFPDAGEQYVRGDRWCVNYPQGNSSFALRLALTPIETTADRLVIEATVAIQTDLLDTHPQVDVESMCNDIDSWVPGNEESDGSASAEVHGSGTAPISIAKSNGHSVSVLLGPHDSPFTTNHSTDMLLRLRLFGEFLEKGVIRKARPWIVIDRSGNVPPASDLQSLWTRLAESPLPLTP